MSLKLSDLFRPPPPRPTSEKKADAPAQQAPKSQPAQTQGGRSDLYDLKPKATTTSKADSGSFVAGGLDFGNFFDDLFTDLFAGAKHRHPSDRTNLAQYAADLLGDPIPITSNDDDPFAKEANIEGMHRTDFDVDKNGKPLGLHGNRATVTEEDRVFRKDATGKFVPFAWNPWPKEVKPDENGRFVFDEQRFPPFLQERGPDGKVIMRDGLQVWTPLQLKVGAATTFEAMNSASRASESWAGREINWGVDGKLDAEPHAFIEFNAFYSPSVKSIFFGVVPYRLPGETQIKMFETASSWEMVAHESGHAVHDALMPNVDHANVGFNTWSESFADQTAMWGSLKDRGRAEALLKEINGDLGKSNSLTRMAEAFSSLLGSGTGIRDAFQDLKISNTTPEVHDRSQVLTGASYKVFQAVYQDQRAHGRSELDALQVAGDVMGTLNLRATEHSPQNAMSLEDVGKAWLKVDKEYFHGKYGSVIADELKKREIFDDGSVGEFQQHEAALPKLSMGYHKNDHDLDNLINKNLSKLGIPQGYSLKVTSHELDDAGAQIVHVQLVQGKDAKKGVELNNHGILTFRPDGSLMDYQNPVPAGATAASLNSVLASAHEAGLDKHGVPVGVRIGDDNQLTAEANQLTGDGMNSSVNSWSLDDPKGTTTSLIHESDLEAIRGLLPPGAQLLTADEIAQLGAGPADPPKPPDAPVAPVAPPVADAAPIVETTASPFVVPAAVPAPEPATDGTDGRQVPPAE